MGIHIHYSPRLQTDKVMTLAVEGASGILEEVAGTSTGLVQADWDLHPDAKGSKVIRLTLQDRFASPTSAEFAPEELHDLKSLHRRLYRLWGDLLQSRSHVQLQRLYAQVEEAGA